MGRHSIKNKRENFIKCHGQEFIDDMEKLKTNYGISCQSIATKYGFSRQHIGDIFKQLNRTTYAAYRKKKTDKVIAEDTDCEFDPRQKLANSLGNERREKRAKTRIRFMEECQKRGFDVKVSSNRYVSLHVNGYAVKIPVLVGQTKKDNSAFTVRGSRLKLLDFYAPYLSSHDAFFIIPVEKLRYLNFNLKYQTVYIRNEFSKYHNAKNRYMDCMNDFNCFKIKNPIERDHA